MDTFPEHSNVNSLKTRHVQVIRTGCNHNSIAITAWWGNQQGQLWQVCSTLLLLLEGCCDSG
jgi:hypothetical protein